jgi:folate-binding protein YgfZ
MNIVWADAERDVVFAQGSDAAAFLHSQLAQDISALAIGGSAHSFLLEPTGHITTLLRVVRHSDSVFTLDTDAGHGASIIQRLQRFILRADVKLSHSDWRVRAFRGDNAAEAVGAVPGAAIHGWGGTDAIDVVGEFSTLPIIGEETEPGHIDVLRVESRWPRVGVDILVGDIPATAGVTSIAVSFSKGCYPGQELVERMDSRGANAPVVLRVIPRDGVGVGMRIEHDGKFLGTVTSVGNTVAFARLDRTSTVGEPLS